MEGGQAEKVGAVYYIAVYTALPSFLFLFPLISFSMGVFSNILIGLCLVGIFASKRPLWFSHYWLPKAHVEAPTVVSILLAAILLKLGFIGILSVVPLMGYEILYWLIFMSLSGVIFASVIPSVSRETKVFAAYSSVNHISLATYCICSRSIVGHTSRCFLSLGHRQVSALIFHLLGELSHNRGTRVLYYNSGIFNLRIWFFRSFLLNLFSNGGSPPSVSFFGEIYFFSMGINLILVGSFTLGVYYLLTFYYNVYGFIQLWKTGQYGSYPEIVVHLSFILNLGRFYIFYLSL